jgi:hypothetical protein
MPHTVKWIDSEASSSHGPKHRSGSKSNRGKNSERYFPVKEREGEGGGRDLPR